MERRIIVLYRTYKRHVFQFHVKFFTDFPRKSLFPALIRFHLPSRELPVTVIIAVTALRGQNAAVIHNNGCNYFNPFHSRWSVFPCKDT